LKHLKIAENNLKTEGAEFIIKNSLNLESLDIGKYLILLSFLLNFIRY
jgi:hypothetical protein